MLIQIQCQHCNQSFEDECLEKTAFCPHCGKETQLFQSEESELKQRTAPMRGPAYPPKRSKTIKEIESTAEGFGGAAVLFFILAVLAFFLSIIAFAGSGNEYGFIVLTASGGLGMTGFWLILIGQIMYIRANTMK